MLDRSVMSTAVGVDIGGTFTDVVLASPDGKFSVAKVLSTAHDYGQGVMSGMSSALTKAGAETKTLTRVAHGTTVASNAILERSGGALALVTTAGFRDVIAIGRLRMPRLYDIGWIKPTPLVPRELRFEVRERMGPDGSVIERLDLASVDAVVDAVRDTGVCSVAISLINSYANPSHEEAVRRRFNERAPQIDVSISADVSRHIREVERTSTVIVNAYLRPVLDNYLSTLRNKMVEVGIGAPLFICQSTGGLTTTADATRRPAAILESGPAAGVVAAAMLARRLNIPRMISFDMGGTTAKAALIEDGTFSQTDTIIVGNRMMTSTRLLNGAGHPVQLPAVDLAEVGAGGGSIVRVDAGGALVVGPESAGASPGPASYGLGGLNPTVTDAAVVLGYLNPKFIAGGEVTIHAELARDVFHRNVARPLGLSCEDSAFAATQVAAATMLRVLRAVSSERGRDPRSHVVTTFGGNGPLFGPLLALQLGAVHALIPPNPGLYSAVGLLHADMERDYVETLSGTLSKIDASSIDLVAQRLREKVNEDLAAAGFSPSQCAVETRLSLRYAGQTDSLAVTLRAGDARIDNAQLLQAVRDFGLEHERTYGQRADDDEPVELVAIHLIGRGFFAPIEFTPKRELEPVTNDFRHAYFGPELGWRDAPVLRRSDLHGSMTGPLIVEEIDSTCLVPPGGRAELDELGNIHLWFDSD